MESVTANRGTLMRGAMISGPLTIGLWWALAFHGPVISNTADVMARLVFAVKCACVAVLLTFMTGIEAVSHERLFSASINPLLGAESARMKINLRYLQNTLEQLLTFLPGLLALAIYVQDARVVLATSVTWTLARAAFWIGYHIGPEYRAPGLTGFAQSLVVLLYVTGRFGYELGGVIGAALPLVIFAGVEIFLVRMSRKG